MSRSVRQAKILELIEKKEITSQEELADELRQMNYDVNQSTVSRDIKELGLIKVMLEGGRSKYAYVDMGGAAKIAGKVLNLFRESVLAVESAGNLIVIKTLSGSANAAAMALDKLNLSGILGSVAGDDTVLVVAREDKDVVEIKAELNRLLHS